MNPPGIYYTLPVPPPLQGSKIPQRAVKKAAIKSIGHETRRAKSYDLSREREPAAREARKRRRIFHRGLCAKVSIRLSPTEKEVSTDDLFCRDLTRIFMHFRDASLVARSTTREFKG